MYEATLLLGFVTLQRLAELAIARVNVARLIAAGGVEFGRSHYPLIVALHAAWLGGLWLSAYDHSVDRRWLVAFVILQAARLWVMASLGRRWTTRVFVVPGETLVARGPYRWLRHPNYVVVTLELAVVPLALGLPLYAVVFLLLNAVVLFIRIRDEEQALAWAKQAKVAESGELSDKVASLAGPPERR